MAKVFVSIKPLTVNQCWAGKRFKTPEYKKYEYDLFYLLPKEFYVPEPPFIILLQFGVSSVLSDWDNPIKPFQDVLQKKYGFNDKHIRKGIVEIEVVQKGNEYIAFELLNYKPQKL